MQQEECMVLPGISMPGHIVSNAHHQPYAIVMNANKDNGVLLDQIAKFTEYLVSKKYPKKLRCVKSFCVTILNAVKCQVCLAIIAYCLVALVRNKLIVDCSTYEMKVYEYGK